MTAKSTTSNKKLVRTIGTIVVNKSVEQVFDIFANPSNDNLWRTEVKKSILNGDLQVGAKISEYSYLSKKASDNLLELQCVQYDKNKFAVFETFDNAQFYLKSERSVKAVSHNTTEITYTLTFDLAIVKYALGFALPKFIVSFKTDRDMKKYLVQLRANLDND
jgi:hypothetical protein